MKIRYLLWLALPLLLLGACESMEDTYGDYAGDGIIRYVGKCTDVSVTPGWLRLIVKWNNNPDSRIKNIKVTWTLDDVTKSELLDAKTTEYSIRDLVNGNYEVRVYGVDADGRESLSTPLFARPYTADHETILSFTRLIAKHYFIRNRLALVFSTWSDAVEVAELRYISGGEEKSFQLTKELVERKYYLLDDAIDAGTKVILNRKGRVEGCEDLIEFEPYEFSAERLYSSDFKQLIKGKYGLANITDDFANSLEELDIDYTITSFEDILNLPNLKVLNLGKNRFMQDDYLAETGNDSQIYEEEASLFALKVANEINGLKVNRYNRHFLEKEVPDFVVEMGNPMPPTWEYMATSDWKISCVPEDEGFWDSGLSKLFDNNPNSTWSPEPLPAARSHEIMVDMKEVKSVQGVKVVQKSFNPADDEMSLNLLPGMIKIKVSLDNLSWHDATYVEENTLGATPGETTVIRFSVAKEARYLKFILNDLSYGQNFSVTLADIGVF